MLIAKKVQIMIIMGIDPGYALVGFGIVQYDPPRFVPVEYGSITTRPEAPFERRLETIFKRTLELIDKRKPEAIAIERLYYTNNAKTVIGVAEARGVILLAAQLKGVPIFEYTPLQVKQAVTGYGQAIKPQMQEMTRRLLCLKEIPKPDDTADALAIAICHGQNCTVKRRMPKTYYFQKN